MSEPSDELTGLVAAATGFAAEIDGRIAFPVCDSREGAIEVVRQVIGRALVEGWAPRARVIAVNITWLAEEPAR